MSATSTVLAEPITGVETPAKERLFSGGMGVLLALAIYVPLQEKIALRFATLLPSWPVATVISNLLLTVALVKWIFWSPFQPQNPRVRVLTRAILGVGLFSTFSFVTAEFFNGGVRFWSELADWKRWSTMILLYFFTRSFITNRKQTTLLFYVMSLVVAYAAINLLRENFSTGVSSSHFKDNLRFGGLFLGGINDLGGFLAEFVFIPIALLSIEKRFIRKAFLLGIVVVVITGCLFTYSRGAWVGLAAGLAVYLLRKSWILLLVVALICVLVGGSLLPASVIDRWQMTQDSEGNLDSSAQARLAAWSEGMRLIKENPFLGVGYGQFKYVVQLRDFPDIHLEPHNSYIKIASEQGLPALVCFIFFLFAAVRTTIGAKDPFDRKVSLAYFGFWVCLIVVNCFGNRITREGLVSYFWIMTGVMAWLCNQRGQVHGDNPLEAKKISVDTEAFEEHSTPNRA